LKPQNFQPQEKVNLEETLTQLILNTSQFMTKTETSFKHQVASIRNLEVQIGQVANLLSSRPQGSLPSNTNTNPKQQVNAIILRSEKQVERPQEIFKEVVVHKEAEASMEKRSKTSDTKAFNLAKEQPQIKTYVP